MRILFVFSRYPAETFAIVEIEALRKHGIDVVPLSLRGGRRWLRRRHATRDSAHEKIRVVPLTSLRSWGAIVAYFIRHPAVLAREFAGAIRENALHPAHLVRSLFVCLKGPAVAGLVRDEGFDAVHVFWGHYPAMIIPFVKRETPWVPATAFLGAYSLVNRVPSGPRVLAEADLLTTHFDGHVEEIRKGWLRRDLPVALIYRGVDIEALKAVPTLPAEGVGIVIVSRLAANKNVEDGIRAFALVHDDHRDIRLDVIGGGPCREDLGRLVHDLGIEASVTFHGLVSHDRTVALVAAASAIVFPSLSPSDFFPNAVKEAMALGVPCAAYAIPGVASFDVSGHALRLAPPGKVEHLARATAELIDDRDIARATVSAARKRVGDFDIRTTSARQAELFRALVGRKSLPAWVH